MKKQLFLILLLALFVGSISSSYGQLEPQAITCLSSDALHPVPGQPYTYSVTVPDMTPAGTVQYHWLVTQQPIAAVNFLGLNNSLTTDVEAIGGAILASGDTWYNAPTDITATNGVNEIELTWQSFAYDPNNPIFVVIQVKNTYGSPLSCTTQNLKVYKIEPLHAFTLDIANRDEAGITQAGYGRTSLDKCISKIDAATYNSVDNSVDYDFGLDTVYYEVVAANWYGQWKPFVQITDLDAEETVLSVDWRYTWPANLSTGWTPDGTMTLVGATYESNANVTIQGSPAPPSVGPAGQSIFIRVIIDHTVDATHNYEGLLDETFKLAVDGTLMLQDINGNWTVDGQDDVHHDNGVVDPGPPIVCNPLVPDGFDNDWALQTLKARPNMNTTTPAVLPVTP